MSPFQIAYQIPLNTKKSVLDAVDGFHVINLDKKSLLLTIFISEWGRYMSLPLPQCFLASTDAYTRSYDGLIKPIPGEAKIMDNTLLYDTNIENAFFSWDYSTLHAKNGIAINKPKFQFCMDKIEFAWLKITPTGVSPTDTILNTIQHFF